MVEPNIYCKVSGMAMRCIADFYRENGRRPVVLEIGCADGQGTMRYAGFTDLTVCVDPMVSGRPDIDSRRKTDLPLDWQKLEDFKRRTSEFPVELVIGCSLWDETFVEVRKRLSTRDVDILIIDGCHHPFEAVWADFETYYPLVSRNGFVIFDDLYEDCILQAFQKANDERDLVIHDRWAINKPGEILQDVGALKRKVF